MIENRIRQTGAGRKRLLVSYSARDLDYVNLSDDTFYAKYPTAAGIIQRNLKSLGWEIQRLGLKQTWNPFVLRKYLLDFQPDLILAYGSTGEVPCWARALSSWRGPVVHCWDDYYDEIWEVTFGKAAGWFMRHLEKRIICRSDFVITLSKYNVARAQRWGKEARYIPNGCDEIQPYDPARAAVKLEGDMKIVYCGNQGRYKRVHELVQAMHRVPRNIRLYLTGAPAPYLEAMAPSNVVFLGLLPKEEVWNVMHQADVLASTSDQDCGCKLHEYLRYKKPLLLRDGKARFFFTDHVNALLTTDYEGAIMELYGDPGLRQALVSNATRDFTVHTWLEIAQEYENAFQGMIALYDGNNGG